MADSTYAMASALLDCLNEAFPQADLPTPGDFCLIAGEQMSEDIDPVNGEDLCCTGRGWVRVGDVYPSSNFPNPDTLAEPCLPTGWAQAFEVGILSCYHPGGDPAAATCAEHNQQAVYDIARIFTLKQVACCFQAKLKENPKWRGRKFLVQSINVSGPRGNCISRVMTVLVSIGRCC
jgi:hypothetical protein